MSDNELEKCQGCGMLMDWIDNGYGGLSQACKNGMCPGYGIIVDTLQDERDEAREWARRMKAERDAQERRGTGYMWKWYGEITNRVDAQKCVDILREQLHQMTAERDWYYAAYNNRVKDFPGIVKERDALRAEVAKLTEAIEFYAHGRNWAGWQYGDETNDCVMWARPIEDDLGKTAREALGWETPEPPEAE